APITEATPLAIRSRHLYAGEVRYVDSEFARLMEGLSALGEADRTLVVITSDHGEEFFEHGWKGHDQSLYHEVLRRPLLLHPAGRRPPPAAGAPARGAAGPPPRSPPPPRPPPRAAPRPPPPHRRRKGRASSRC